VKEPWFQAIFLDELQLPAPKSSPFVSIPDIRPTLSGARILVLWSLCLGCQGKGSIDITQSQPSHCLVYEPA
jgi:hypothetical protein